MKKPIMTFLVIIIGSSLAAVAFLNLNDANMRYSTAKTDLETLQDDYNDLNAKYYSLLGNYSNIEYEYQNVLLQNPFAVPNPADSGTPETQQTLSRYQALQQMYSDLQDEYNQYLAAYQTLKNLVNRRIMHSDLEFLITPNDPEVISLTYNITGKTGNTTDPNSYWKDIKALYNWVNDNIKYRDDGLYPSLPNTPTDSETRTLQLTDQMVQMPNETLYIKAGDCEDTAVLLVSMIRAYFSNQFLSECIWITGENAGHVAVVVPFGGEQIVILDPVRDYFSHNTLGDISLNTISSEIYNWMNIWRPSLGNDVHVYRVFSDYMDKYFHGTEEYIDWMYNR